MRWPLPSQAIWRRLNRRAMSRFAHAIRGVLRAAGDPRQSGEVLSHPRIGMIEIIEIPGAGERIGHTAGFDRGQLVLKPFRIGEHRVSGRLSVFFRGINADGKAIFLKRFFVAIRRFLGLAKARSQSQSAQKVTAK